MARNYVYATGRRKTAVARVRLFPGDGTIVVNGKNAEEYFGLSSQHAVLFEPFTSTDTRGRFSVMARVDGGGLTGQAGAIRHGIARALVGTDESLKPQLRKAGLLTRDPRVKERKKYGLKRARKAPQYTKR